jgi:hypothetical protein
MPSYQRHNTCVFVDEPFSSFGMYEHAVFYYLQLVPSQLYSEASADCRVL